MTYMENGVKASCFVPSSNNINVCFLCYPRLMSGRLQIRLYLFAFVTIPLDKCLDNSSELTTVLFVIINLS